MSRFAHKLLVTALCAIVVGVAPAAARAADSDPGRTSAARGAGWTKAFAVDLSRDELGLPGRASAERLARAALTRYADRMGLSRSSGGLRLASQLRPPATGGGRPIRTLRFQQTAGGLRVVWSQIDVTIAGGEVSSISATVVPVKGRRPAGRAQVSRAQALRIARRAVPNAEAPLLPLPAAYAGTPSTKRAAKWRQPKRVWVVELQPPAAPGEDAPSGLCIVIDAQSGKLIARWPGSADRPDRAKRPRTGIAQLIWHRVSLRRGGSLFVGRVAVRLGGRPDRGRVARRAVRLICADPGGRRTGVRRGGRCLETGVAGSRVARSDRP